MLYQCTLHILQTSGMRHLPLTQMPFSPLMAQSVMLEMEPYVTPENILHISVIRQVQYAWNYEKHILLEFE